MREAPEGPRTVEAGADDAPDAAGTGPVASRGGLIVVLMFAAVMLNYVDRQIIALLKPTLQAQFGWSEAFYGHLGAVFQGAGAVGCLLAGWFIDRAGVRRGFAVSVAVWSLSAMAHGLARTGGVFLTARAALGLAEAAGTPAVVKAAGAYFAPVRRTRVLGLSNMAPSLGAVVAPLAIPPLAVAFGWRATFLGAGALGLAWAAAWMVLTRGEASRRGPAPVVGTLPAARSGSFVRLLRDPRTYGFMAAKASADVTWWFLLFYMPDFFHRRFHLAQGALGAPVAAVYLMAAGGAAAGGALYGTVAARIGPAWPARRAVLALFAAGLLIAPLIEEARSATMAAAGLGLLLFAYQGFSTNVFGLAADRFAAESLATAVGLATFVGNLAGVATLEAAGWTLQAGLGYQPLFLMIAASGFVSLAWLQLSRARAPSGPRGAARPAPP